MDQKKIIETVKKILKTSSDNDLSVYAGNATLYIMMAAIPLLMLVVAAVNMMPGFSVEDFQNTICRFLPDIQEIQTLIANIIQNLNRQSSGLVASLSALTTLWSASGGISAIQRGLKKMLNVPSMGFRDKIIAVLYTFLFIIQFVFMLVFQVLGSSIKEILASISGKFILIKDLTLINSLINSSGLITIALAFLILLLTFTYLPGGKRKLKSQIPGALLTSLIWFVFSVVFSFFIPRFWKASSLYGSLASVFLMAMWLRTMITILFYGAALNNVLPEGNHTQDAS